MLFKSQRTNPSKERTKDRLIKSLSLLHKTPVFDKKKRESSRKLPLRVMVVREGEYCAEAKNWYDYALDVCLRIFLLSSHFCLSSGGVYKIFTKILQNFCKIFVNFMLGY